MSIKTIKNDIEKLKEQDVFSLSLFLLYQLEDIPGYQTISELPYILNHESLLNLCKFYGGTTITIPTFKELMETMKVLMLYQYKEIDGISWKNALEKAGWEKKEYRRAENELKKFKALIKKYNIFKEEEKC